MSFITTEFQYKEEYCPFILYKGQIFMKSTTLCKIHMLKKECLIHMAKIVLVILALKILSALRVQYFTRAETYLPRICISYCVATISSSTGVGSRQLQIQLLHQAPRSQ